MIATGAVPLVHEFDILPLGAGRFSVTGLDETFSVQIRPDRSLTCTCRSAGYIARCAHQAAVLTYCTQFHHLPEQADIPAPIDVTQIEQEALNTYIVLLNRAHNVLTVQKVAALTPLAERVSGFKHQRRKLAQMKLLKAEPQALVAAMEELDQAEDAKDVAQLALDIIGAKMEDVQTATMRAQSVLKTLRP